MLRGFFVAVSLCYFALVSAAFGQSSWVQVEALPDLRTAQERARAYSSALQNVNGFRLRSGWYALALGPFPPAQAQSLLNQLKSAGIIPNDSYISDSRPYREQFWPIGGQQTAPAPQTSPTAPVEVAPQPPVELDETPRQARASEATLTRDERRELQTALQWFGFYSSTIDGAFGRGTRNSMGNWQLDKGLEVTGILTTKQRALLRQDYADALAELGLAELSEDRAGIDLIMPLGLVEFDRYEYPFAQFKERGDSGVQALLISQAGDVQTLGGLYEIMQTLEIVPLEGQRQLGRDRFTLTGQNDQIHSYTFARTQGGYVKGFSLVYPPTKAAEMERVIKIMQDSLKITEGTLTPDLTDEGAQAVDLLAGLDLRKPKTGRSGFYVDQRGHVVTVAEAVGQCERITLDGIFEARVTASDGRLAILEPIDTLAPLNFARLAANLGRLRSQVAVAGYSYEGTLGAPTLTYGNLADIRGLNGEDDLKRLDLASLSGDVGGPVLDPTGAVTGILIDVAPSGRALPQGTRFALKSTEVARFLSENGIEVAASQSTIPMDSEDLVQTGTDMTVLVSCW